MILLGTFFSIFLGFIILSIIVIYVAGKAVKDDKPAPSERWEREWEALEENLRK
jgi:hypothetical protein